VLVIVCPGQGSQTPGFLSPWLEVDDVADRLGWLSAVAGIDLVAHGTTSDADTIRDTAVAQPLLVAAGLVAVPALAPADGDGTVAEERVADVVAGHSVGELTAAALSGVLTEEQAVVLVRERGRAMAAASAVTPTGMSAVLGGNPDDVSAAIEKHGLTAANINAAGQVVAAGTLEQLAGLAADPPAKTRIVPLQVAGAFHTAHMAPAVETLARLARAVRPRDPRTRLLSNRDGAVVRGGGDALSRIVDQVSNPVRWDLCTATLAELGVTGLLELPPAGTLAGLAKRALPGVELVALKTPDDLPAARALLENHASGGTA
jgi:[acyl-carrier-protein] S-malonyltransferase